MKLRALVSCAAVLASTLFCDHALAGGFSTISVLPDHATAVTTTPVASYTNPAALHAKEGLRLFFDSSLVSRFASFDRATSDTVEPPDAKGANTGKATLHNTLIAPIMSAAYTHGPIAAGLGVFVPFGGAAEWSKNKKFTDNLTYVGAVDSQARWHGISAMWTTTYLTGSLSFELIEGLSLGVAGNLVLNDLNLTQALTVQLDDSLLSESRANYRLSGVDESFGVGLHWEALADVLWLGVSYQAPPGLWKGALLKGDVAFNYPTGAATLPRRDIYIRQNFPDIVQFGARYRAMPDLELRLTGNYQRWSAVKSQCLAYTTQDCDPDSRGFVEASPGIFANWARRWHDTFGLRAAATYFLDRVSFLGAVAYDGTAVPDSTLDPAAMDGHDLTFNLGAGYAFSKRVSLVGSVAWQHMLERDNRGKSQLQDSELPNKVPSANGVFQQDMLIANLNLELAFSGL